MEAILLKRKDESKADKDLVIFDEVVTGFITQEVFIPVFGEGKTMGFMPVSYLIDNYLFPTKDGKWICRFLHFLNGYNPEIMEEIEFYESEEIAV